MTSVELLFWGKMRQRSRTKHLSSKYFFWEISKILNTFFLMERSNVPRNFNYIQTKLWNTRISTPLHCTVQLKYVLSFDSFLNDGAQAYNMLRPVTYSRMQSSLWRFLIQSKCYQNEWVFGLWLTLPHSILNTSVKRLSEFKIEPRE